MKTGGVFDATSSKESSSKCSTQRVTFSGAVSPHLIKNTSPAPLLRGNPVDEEEAPTPGMVPVFSRTAKNFSVYGGVLDDEMEAEGNEIGGRDSSGRDSRPGNHLHSPLRSSFQPQGGARNSNAMQNPPAQGVYDSGCVKHRYYRRYERLQSTWQYINDRSMKVDSLDSRNDRETHR